MLFVRHSGLLFRDGKEPRPAPQAQGKGQFRLGQGQLRLEWSELLEQPGPVHQVIGLPVSDDLDTAEPGLAVQLRQVGRAIVPVISLGLPAHAARRYRSAAAAFLAGASRSSLARPAIADDDRRPVQHKLRPLLFNHNRSFSLRRHSLRLQPVGPYA